MINKATALEERHQTITWGAAQLGIAQGVLDAVADELLPPTDDVLVLVCVWVDPAASDETAVRRANRQAVRMAIGVAVNGRDPGAAAALVARRDEVTSPFYGDQVRVKITAIGLQRLRLLLDPPFYAACGPTASACSPTSTSARASAVGRTSSFPTTRPDGRPGGETSCSPSR